MFGGGDIVPQARRTPAQSFVIEREAGTPRAPAYHRSEPAVSDRQPVEPAERRVIRRYALVFV